MYSCDTVFFDIHITFYLSVDAGEVIRMFYNKMRTNRAKCRDDLNII